MFVRRPTRLISWLAFAALPASSALAGGAAGTWERQSPLPYPGQGVAKEIAFAGSSGRGYITGEAGAPMETTDGGQTWHERQLGQEQLTGVFFLDQSNGWIVGNAGFRTTDGGVTWQPMNMIAGSWRHLDFVSPSVGWMSTQGAGGIAKTTNGGQAWTLQAFTYPEGFFVYGVDFRDADVGLACVTNQADPSKTGIYRTANGGGSWTKVSDAIAGDLLWLDANTVIADSTFGQPLMRSTNAGQSFQPLATPVASLTHPFSPDGQTLVALAADYYGSGTFIPMAANGDVWMSPDRGDTWTKAFTGPLLPFEGGTFVSGASGFAVGLENLVIRTDDGGHTWRYVSSGCTQQLEDVEMLDDHRGVAVGWDGTVLVTEDGGGLWEPARPGLTESFGGGFLNVSVVPPDFVVAAGYYGTMIKSADGGRTWQGVSAGTGDIWSMDFLTPQKGWRGHEFGSIYSTNDGGVTWTQQYDGIAGVTQPMYDLHFVDDQHGWAAGARWVLRTTNGGQTWQEIGMGSKILRSIDFVDQNVGYVGGYAVSGALPYIAKSVNGGATWQPQQVPITGHVLSIDAVSATEVWAATIEGDVIHTTNGGQTWQVVETGFNDYADGWQGLAANAAGDVWLAGDSGHIVHRIGTAPQPCLGDANGDHAVNVDDLFMVINAWGPCGACAADLTDDGAVDIDDLFAVINAWGSCP